MSAVTAQVRTFLGWTALVLSIAAVFIGGAGVVMIVAGHINAATVSLASACAVGGGYTAWFLYRGPGRFSAIETLSPEPRSSDDWTTARLHIEQVSVVPVSSHRAICWFCGKRERANNRVVWGDRAAICEHCARSALGLDDEDSEHGASAARDHASARSRLSR